VDDNDLGNDDDGLLRMDSLLNLSMICDLVCVDGVRYLTGGRRVREGGERREIDDEIIGVRTRRVSFPLTTVAIFVRRRNIDEMMLDEVDNK